MRVKCQELLRPDFRLLPSAARISAGTGTRVSVGNLLVRVMSRRVAAGQLPETNEQEAVQAGPDQKRHPKQRTCFGLPKTQK